MNCIEFASNLDLYIDGELPLEEAAAAQRHLSECPHCDGKCRAEETLKDMLRDKLPRHACTDCIRDDVRHMVLNSVLV